MLVGTWHGGFPHCFSFSRLVPALAVIKSEEQGLASETWMQESTGLGVPQPGIWPPWHQLVLNPWHCCS